MPWLRGLRVHDSSESRFAHLERIASETEGFSGAELEEVVISGLYKAFADGRHPDADRRMWDTIRERSFAVHVWNRKTAGITFANGSLLHRLHNTWTVLPEREECT